MKANAPERIWIDYLDEGFWFDSPSGNKSIEYIRKDVFIKKVQSFLNKKDDRDSYTIGYIKRHLKEIIKEVGL